MITKKSFSKLWYRLCLKDFREQVLSTVLISGFKTTKRTIRSDVISVRMQVKKKLFTIYSLIFKGRTHHPDFSQAPKMGRSFYGSTMGTTNGFQQSGMYYEY